MVPVKITLAAPDTRFRFTKRVASLFDCCETWQIEKMARYSTSSNVFAVDQSKNRAIAETREHSRMRDALKSILATKLTQASLRDWAGKEATATFKASAFRLKKPGQPERVPEPTRPNPGFMERIFGGAKRLDAKYQAACAEVADKNAAADKAYEAQMQAWREARDEHIQADKAEERKELENINRINSTIAQSKKEWKSGQPEAVCHYATAVIRLLKLPPPLAEKADIQFDPPTHMLVVDYALPTPDDLPLLKNKRYDQSAGKFTTTKISKAETTALYDDTCYQACLRIMQGIFLGDSFGHIRQIAFNGVVEARIESTGKTSPQVILSILASREDFEGIDFANVNPKACFKHLKGVSASSLIGLSAVPPVISFNKADKRFIAAQTVDLKDDGSVNLASMPWEEFEHLVRQLFEQEFASRGGEVKVTQSSADGGVDAVAFDPDPITGGKIVIQAKRYTRPVGVSAVRDLFGTTQSEGASKGILVTTTDFGPDAYKFAQGKPLTLLNGANLLHLLHKHGMKARIDVAEARTVLGLSGKRLKSD